jgi:hypothetical protein
MHWLRICELSAIQLPDYSDASDVFSARPELVEGIAGTSINSVRTVDFLHLRQMENQVQLKPING